MGAVVAQRVPGEDPPTTRPGRLRGGDTRTLAQLRADIAIDLLLGGTVARDDGLGHAPAGRLQVIVPLGSILPADLVAEQAATGRTPAAAGVAFDVGEVPGLGFLHAAHRGHHNVKTGRFWSSQQHQDASITWQALTKRLRTTAFNHDRPGDQCLPFVSRFEREFGIRLALCREHDVIPNVFTDLEDLHLLADQDLADSQESGSAQGQDQVAVGDHINDRVSRPQGRWRMQFYRPTRDIRIELPEPPPF